MTGGLGDVRPVVVEWLRLNAGRASLALGRALLDPAERSKARSFHSDAAREQYILGRTALRLVLGEYLGIAAAEIELVTDRHGKPRLASNGSRELHFNVSHSAGHALIALSRCGEVGVDIEMIGRRWPDPLVRKLLKQPQLAHLAGLPAERRAEQLCDFWVRKEAYLKALGLGVGACFEVEPTCGGWWVRSIDVGPRCRAAVCGRYATRVLVRRRRLSQLLDG